MRATRSTFSHWALPFIGARYVPGATGPAEFDCWGLVCAAVAQRHGRQLPQHMRPQAARALGWRPVQDNVADGDVVMMRSPYGQRHVGMAVQPGRELSLLHAIQHRGVCLQPLCDLPAQGYANMQAWRPA
jgi:cell wall-associated NlpC family hydrolase